LQRGDEAAAISQLNDLMAAHPESTRAAALFAQVLERRGETDRAAAMKQWSLQKPEPIAADPWMAELDTDLYDVQRLGLKFEAYFNTGQLAEATPFLQRIEELDPKSPIPPLLRGWSAARAHRDSEAVVQYRQALTKGGDPEKICPFLVQSLLALGNTTEAVALTTDYYARFPDSIPLTKAYADVAVRLGNEKLARTLLEKVLLKEPYLQAQNMSLAKILWTSGEKDAAAVRLRHVALVDTHDVASRALLGEFHLGRADPLSAIEPLEQANARVAPNTTAQAGVRALLGQAYFQTADRLAEQNRFEDAVAYYDKFIQLAPADLNGYVGKANASVQLKQFRRAAEALDKMIALDPSNPTIYLSLGDVFYQDGNREQARQNWEKARPLVAPGDSELIAALNVRLSGRVTAETFK
ncbi:MAG: tetratricopeptide repeat protein, partial [Opitutaceae bacterium]